MISNLHVGLKGNTDIQLNGTNLRAMVLTTVKRYRNKFGSEFGELVIACDADARGGSWRRDVFPYYKCRRSKAKERSGLDWPMINETFNEIIEEVKENFPYRTIRVNKAEADDVIGILCHRYGSAFSTDNPIMIVSGDQDFYQFLPQYDNIFIWDHLKKVEIKKKNIDPNCLHTKIITGDAGDDIPNILTQDDTFAIGKRSKSMTGKKLEEFLSKPMTEWDTLEVDRYNRNKRLIDLSQAPDTIKDAILETYETEGGKGKSKVYSYLVKNRLRELLSEVADF